MLKYASVVFLTAFGLLCSCGAPVATGSTESAGSSSAVLEAPDIKTVAKPIPGFMRGINLGNGFDAPSEGAWGVTLSEKHFQMAAAAGLDHVRLPVRFSVRAEVNAPYTISEEFFKRVDWAIAQAHANKLSIIVDLHHYEEIMKDPAAHSERLMAMWKQIAERYKNEPATVAFEILNEPTDKLTSELLNPMMKAAVEIIRQSNPDRLIFVNCAFWANTEYLDKLDLSWSDDNVIPTFHMYQPILFSHQGAPWMGPDFKTTGIVFPGPPATPLDYGDVSNMPDWVIGFFENYNNQPAATNPCGPFTIYLEFGRVTAYIEKTGKRAYLGEFAANDKIDPVSRENFVRMVRQESERRGFGWALWDDGGMNMAMNVKTGQWVPEIQRALFK